jgi:hypothetical protein
MYVCIYIYMSSTLEFQSSYPGQKYAIVVVLLLLLSLFSLQERRFLV